MRGLRTTTLQLGYQVRQRYRVAQFLQAARRCRRHDHRSELAHGAHRSALRSLRRTSWTRIPRRSASDRRTLLHEWDSDEVRAEVVSGDPARISNLSRRVVGEWSEFQFAEQRCRGLDGLTDTAGKGVHREERLYARHDRS